MKFKLRNQYIRQQMTSEVFNSSGLMGTMPKRVIMQAEYFWAQDHAAVTGPKSQIGTTLSGMAQGLLNAATETVGTAARLINRFWRRFASKVAASLGIPGELHAVSLLYHTTITDQQSATSLAYL
ncbi:uncharacterized protein F5147DRAFT_659132 [Suillus discolor]|uniref:Uncharacterized protein n=1 Tax=Suillus discolor TaxID=1912936 RepID=A0A9P7JLM0_9AGAM|nr:uncharacterized protein F5147DRAFT_659132 [Suillus discolor]KAG2086756.1 hypothetical protein F5147DRAFT_659132 [Suillus discolor]